MHIQDKPGVLLSKEKKNGKEEISGGDNSFSGGEPVCVPVRATRIFV